MQLRTPSIGEVEEVGNRAVKAGETLLATGTLEDLDASIAASRQFTAAVGARFSPTPSEREDAAIAFQALLQDALERGEREAFDEHYDSQVPPCEVDVVEPDPWVEEREAVAADLQADAIAFESEARS
jgi:hypothetical protein